MWLERRSVLLVLLALIFLSFFGTLAIAASMFPHGYDWRYQVISSLLSPRDNPQRHWLAASGVILTGLLMLPFAGHLYRSLHGTSRHGAAIAGLAFLIGVSFLILDCFVVPQHVHATLGVRRLHVFLDRSSAGFLTIAMLTSCWCAWIGRGRIVPRPVFWIWTIVTTVPIAGVVCSELLLLLTRVNPDWAQPIQRTLRHSVFWHLGFWEWIGAVAVFVFLCAATLLFPTKERSS